ncbi:MAG: shikimate dehydrogenase [Candidatus Magnetomorum sp.]|nr:shikimate dehydrogenase [Candidatus Magnetomorum sp.]
MKTFGIISDERAFRSKSPLMHNHVFKSINMDAVYVPFCVQSSHIENALKGIKALHVSGVNVTVPYKQTVIPFLDQLSDEAAAIGAVNTIDNKDEKLVGYNTDASGLMDVFELNHIALSNRNALVFGTGGAARAVLYALKHMQTSIVYVAGRDTQKTSVLAKDMSVQPVSLYDVNLKALCPDIIINATSISSPEESKELAVFIQQLSMYSVSHVIDINYGRKTNIWQNLSQRLGATFMDGRNMLAAQAARSFYIWTANRVNISEYMSVL